MVKIRGNVRERERGKSQPYSGMKRCKITLRIYRSHALFAAIYNSLCAQTIFSLRASEVSHVCEWVFDMMMPSMSVNYEHQKITYLSHASNGSAGAHPRSSFLIKRARTLSPFTHISILFVPFFYLGESYFSCVCLLANLAFCPSSLTHHHQHQSNKNFERCSSSDIKRGTYVWAADCVWLLHRKIIRTGPHNPSSVEL